MNKQAQKAIDQAMVQLFFDHPFYSSILLKREFVQTTQIPTLGVNFTHLYYNPDFFLSLPPRVRVAALAHETLHPALGHLTRVGSRDKMRWNMAGDFVINAGLKKDGMQLGPNWLFDPKYDGMSTEEIYEKLTPDEMQNIAEQGDGDGDGDQSQPGGLGQDIDFSGKPKDASTQAAQEAQIKVELAQAAAIAKAQGKLPGHLNELVDGLLKPRVPWGQELAMFFNNIARNNYNWFPPSTRYLQYGIVLPRLRNVELGEIVFIIDTSGSMSVDELKQANTEACHVLHTFRPSKTHVIYADSAVSHVETYDTPDVPFKPMAPGRGGTNFIPAFQYIEEQGIEPVCAVYISDMECNQFPKEPAFPVLWVNTHTALPYPPPFGRVINLQ